MMCSIRFFELTLPVDTEDFNKLLDRAYRRTRKSGRVYEADFGHADESLLSEGIGIAYHGDSKKKKIRFVIHPASVIDKDGTDDLWEPTSGNIKRLIGKLDKLIGSYFQSDYELSDLILNRVDFAVDVDVGSKDKVSDYIKILHNIRKVRYFSPIKPNKRDGTTKDSFFGLAGNTNGIEFYAYRIKDAKRLLRVEIRLTSKDVIKGYSGDVSTDDQIKVLAENGDRVFMETFKYIVPPGNYLKKSKVDKIIWEKIKDTTLRYKMIKLVTLIPEKKSLHLAIKAFKSKDIKEVMAGFAELGVSPVTIAKRHERKELPSLYSYLE